MVTGHATETSEVETLGPKKPFRADDLDATYPNEKNYKIPMVEILVQETKSNFCLLNGGVTSSVIIFLE